MLRLSRYCRNFEKVLTKKSVYPSTWLAIKRYYCSENDTYHCKKLMMKSLEEQDFDRAMQLLNRVKRIRNHDVEFMYGFMITHLTKNNQIEDAFDLFHQMQQQGFPMDPRVLTSLINGCGTCRDTGKAMSYLREIRQYFVENDIKMLNIHYSAMIKCYGWHNDIPKALQCLREMTSGLDKVETAKAYNLALSSTSYSKDFGVKNALTVWQNMRRHNVTPNFESYVLLLRTIKNTGIGDLEPAGFLVPGDERTRLQIFDAPKPNLLALIREQQQSEYYRKSDKDKPKLISLQTLRELFQRNCLNLFGGPIGFIQEMRHDKLEANAKMLTLLERLDLHGPFVKHTDDFIGYGKLQLGKSEKKKVSTRKIEEPAIIAHSEDGRNLLEIIKEHAENDDFVSVFKVFNEAKSINYENLDAIYSYVIGKLNRLSRTEDAFSIFQEMKSQQIAIDPTTYTSLITGCAYMDDSHRALEILHQVRKHMKLNNAKPDLRCYKAMINAYGRHQHVLKATVVFDEMKAAGFSTDVQDTYNRLLNATLTKKTDGINTAFAVWRYMRSRTVQPNAATYYLLLRNLQDCELAELTPDGRLSHGDNRRLLLHDGRAPNLLVSSNERDVTREDVISNPEAKVMTADQLREILKVDSLALCGGVIGVIDEMKKDNVPLDNRIANLLWDLSTKSQNDADQILKFARRSRIFLDDGLFTKLAQIKEKPNIIAENYSNIQKKEIIENNEPTTANPLEDGESLLIQAKEHRKNEDFDNLLNVFNRAKSIKSEKLHLIYPIVISELSRRNRLSEAFGIFDEMLLNKVGIHESVYSSLISGCAYEEDTSKAMDLLQSLTNFLSGNDIQPSARLFYPMINAYGRHGLLHKAFQLFDEMRAKGYPAEQDEMYNRLLSATLSRKTNGINCAFSIWQFMRSRNIHPNFKAHILFLQHLLECQLGELTPDGRLVPGDEHRLVFEEGRIPNLMLPATTEQSEIDNTTVVTADQLREILKEDSLALCGGVKGIMEEMKKDNVTPNNKIANMLWDLSGKSYGDAREILNATRQHRILLSDNLYATLMEITRNREQQTANEQKYDGRVEELTDLLQERVGSQDFAGALSILEQAKSVKHRELKHMYRHMIVQFCKIDDIDQAFGLLEEMDSLNFNLHRTTCTSLINVCAYHKDTPKAVERLDYLRQFFSDNNIELSIIHYHALINAFGRHGRVNAVLEIIDEMRSKGVATDFTESYNRLLSSLPASDQILKHTLGIYQVMRGQGVPPDAQTYFCLLQNVQKNGQDLNLDGCLIPGDEKTRLTLANTANPNLLAEIRIKSQNPQTFDDLEAADSLTVDNLREAFAEDKLSIFGGLKGLIDEMELDNVKPSTSLVCAILELTCDTFGEMQVLDYAAKHKVPLGNRARDAIARKRELAKMNEQKGSYEDEFHNIKRITPDTFSDLLEYHVRNEDMDSALKLLDSAKSLNVGSLNFMYRYLITQLSKRNQMHKAFDLFDEMISRGLQTHDSTFTSLFNVCAYSTATNRDEAKKRVDYLRKFMNDNDIKPTLHHYYCLINVYGRQGFIPEAFELLREMEDKGLSTRLEDVNRLLISTRFCQEANVNKELSVWQYMRRKGIKPTKKSYAYVIRTLTDAKVGKLTPDGCLIPGDPNSRLYFDNQGLPNLLTELDAEKQQQQLEIIDSLEDWESDERLIPVDLLIDLVQEDKFAPCGGINGLIEEMKRDEIIFDVGLCSDLMEAVLDTTDEAIDRVLELAEEYDVKLGRRMQSALSRKKPISSTPNNSEQDIEEDEEAASDTDDLDYFEETPTLQFDSYVTLLLNHIKNNDVDGALKVLNEAKSVGDQSLDYLYRNLIAHLSKIGEVERAFDLFDDMQTQQFIVSPNIYTNLINVCASCKNTAKAMEHLNRLKEHCIRSNVTFDLVHYDSLINAYGCHNQIQDAIGIIDEMSEKGYPVGIDVFNRLFRASLEGENAGVNSCLNIWELIRRHNIGPNVETYHHLLSAIKNTRVEDFTPDTRLLKDNSCEEGTMPNLLASIRSGEQQLQTDSFAEDKLVSVDSLKETLEKNKLHLFGGLDGIIGEMRKDNIVPDTKLLTLLLELTPESNHQKYHILEYAKENNVMPDDSFYDLLAKKRKLSEDLA